MDAHFPIGPIQYPQTLDAARLAAYAASLRASALALRPLLTELSEEQLGATYAPGSWTVRQLAHHIADAHEHGSMRFRFGLTQDTPTILPFDQETWARLPDYALVPEVSLRVFEGVTDRWAALLDALPPGDLAREIVHPQEGRQSLWRLLAKHDWHARHHTAHIRMALSLQQASLPQPGRAGSGAGGRA